MFKFASLVIAASLFSTLSFAESIPMTSKELAHDSSACPDLTGTYTYKVMATDENDTEVSCVSSKNEAGLSVLTFNGNPNESVVLDGIRKDISGRQTETVLCNNQVIYFYTYEKDSLIGISTIKFDAEKNLLFYLHFKATEQLPQDVESTIEMKRKK